MHREHPRSGGDDRLRSYQGVTYTTRETVLDLGPIQATRETTKIMPLPPVLGGMALLGGVVLIVLGARRV